jgi:hypothetical protein
LFVGANPSGQYAVWAYRMHPGTVPFGWVAVVVVVQEMWPLFLVLGADRWVFIDWDGAGPGSRLWDLAYAVRGFVPLEDGGDPATDGPRLRAEGHGTYWATSADYIDRHLDTWRRALG